ncbi:acyltransferase [Sphingomonas rubra]|uniref:acyltransferase n=1 Tax=Sphingomonas rubra TaxID=634430 RepID=UPI0015A624E9|nr:acyltransferase [Sphingomonas rubra]
MVLRRGGTLRVDGEFSIYSGATVTIGEGATLSLGSGYVNGDASISCFLDVRIGHGVAIGPEFMLIDDDRHQLSGTRGTSGPIVVGDHVWLGSRVTVLKGVTIGNGAVIAAGSVVTKDVAAGELWGGVPARHLRTVEWT